MRRSPLLALTLLAAGGCSSGSLHAADGRARDGGPADRPVSEVGVRADAETDGFAVGDAGQLDSSRLDRRPADSGKCWQARRLWFEDWETKDYSRWTGGTYVSSLNPSTCFTSGFDGSFSVSPASSHRTSISCAASSSHRIYGGVQFNGDKPLASYTNTGTGIDAPHGIVVVYNSRLDVPYAFGGGRWFSFFTANATCNWSDTVITLGLEDPSNRLTPAHIVSTGGTVTFAPGAPTVPLRQWVRTTVYLNYHQGSMHVWQDGKKLLQATFSRPLKTVCHFHWGLYASGDNTSIVLHEDDLSVWKLEEAWLDFQVEPWFGHTQAACPS